jgi:hypothetical protein
MGTGERNAMVPTVRDGNPAASPNANPGHSGPLMPSHGTVLRSGVSEYFAAAAITVGTTPGSFSAPVP